MLDPQYLDAIKGFEGYTPTAKWDYKQSSSGYSTRAQPGDENIPPDQLKAVHEQRFSDEIGKAAASVDAFAPDLPPGIRAALTSLTYNAGPGWQQSGLGKAIAAGDFEAAKGIFPQYNKAGGEVNKGLAWRRAQELGWWDGKPQAAPATPSAPANGLLQAQAQVPAAGGLGAAQPPQAGGLLQAPPPQAQQAPPMAAAQMPQALTLNIPQMRRPQVDLTRLRTQLQNPIFPRRA